MKDVTWIVLDVDGTLTDGKIIYDDKGGETKAFHVADGLGIVMAQSMGLRIAILSGRSSTAVARRMAELKVTQIVQGAGDKAAKMRALMREHNLMPEQIAYVGDDLNDLPAFDVAGVRIAVANADALLLARADYVTPRAGGAGAVRDAIDEILRRQGRYDDAVAQYLRTSAANAATPSQ
ncbi:3-deoxy-D-manno-octulosonate 8-phosphate phosphatase [Capsulimonas corticalis]|uniref:3-deoxy-D-manno-octulosonate 8-phosphate phosphatase n=1 Tax=Capsulimonas corticalis TaxID=2219043 RepID=A0A402CY94_9BACT|nr:HAD-IIIA family hydrolase [Capsulimonas corticalis]BDI31422.1 3-deoxy-D-manno-octulosonate 8-phosphate phosphatase [Capsulimonas corticalis]